MGVSFVKMRILVCNFLFCLEDHSDYYSNEKQLLCAHFSLTTGLDKFGHTSVQMRIIGPDKDIL